MKNKLFEALTTKDMLTENAMPTHSSSGSFVVDLFYEMGGYRNGRKPISDLVGLFFSAFGEDDNLALKCLFYLRDPRGGMGERFSARALWHFLAKAHPDLVNALIPHIAEFGRWDDLIFSFLGTESEDTALAEIIKALTHGDKLCAKWMPRENKRHGEIAKYLAKKFSLTPKQYRKLLAGNTDVVETLMCNREWDEIKFPHVPSLAMKKYRKAFERHQPERFNQYLEDVKSGKAKINTSVLTPVDLVGQYVPADWVSSINAFDKTIEAQWDNLPDVVPENLSFLPVCDVSGSMFISDGMPFKVSVALGIYLSQRNKSVFRNGFITFSNRPTLVTLTGSTLHDNVQQMMRIILAQNTDLEATFRLILDSAVRARLSSEDMPTHLMIISDMQFDRCVENGSNTALEMIDRMYSDAGYQRPNIFFWNVATAGGIPAKITDSGIGLVSGYSPNLLKNVLQGNLNPLIQVEAVLNSGRYDFVNELV